MTNNSTGATTKQAFYFGYRRGDGHFFQGGPRPATLDPQRLAPGIPWTIMLMDTGLLKNGKVPDVYDGKVFWTAARDAEDKETVWHAFYWWDRSGDSRPGSNSGFYVTGFGLTEREAAWKFACEAWPTVIARQRHFLVLQPVEQHT
ncbi:hypothetical protein Rctr197k_277 [Virus Rctr197k]|nr:hypothetical protein Rctr197k_277 [Virus Rctr197k]